MFQPTPAERYIFVGEGIGGLATKNTTTNFDYKITADNLYFSGAEATYKDAVMGDYIKCVIIDKDNILGFGANYIVSIFADKWYLDADGGFSYVDLTYAGQVPINLYLRVTYVSTGTILNPTFYCNLYIHKKQ